VVCYDIEICIYQKSVRVKQWHGSSQSLKKIAGGGGKAKLAQNLLKNRAENALKLHASCAQIELKDPLKIGEKLPESCA